MESIAIIKAAQAGIKTAIDITKKISEVSDAIKQADLKLQLANLIEALADAKIQFADVKDVLLEKDNKIKELEDRLKRDSELTFNENYGVYETEIEGKFVRYCLKCHTEGKYIPLQVEDRRFTCNNCNQQYQRPEYYRAIQTNRKRKKRSL
ncbi:hypothetical protein [Desulfovibrio gilichinskyi]|uniref:Uncharacterized protein n=1 Tax=Desulfovibrio gilichinskyi TaxID=1519643 RepID=A0A1X7CHT8_9BACT|nr:hypothetical protein [Desulfovibrio gilichinskyi]SME96610.1 hypothetical protein SAMN06295933_0903 [Desulfovibrio gilichinskyi]